MAESNFRFLKDSWQGIAKEATDAEKLVLTCPKASALLSRSALEMAVRWMFENDSHLSLPYDDRLAALIHDPRFASLLKPESIGREINLIRLYGNNAAHGKNVTREEAFHSIKNLFRFLSFLTLYYSKQRPNIPQFDVKAIPDGREETETQEKLTKLQEEIEKRLQKDAHNRKKIKEQAKTIESLEKELEVIRHQYTELREEREEIIIPEREIPELTPEQETRKLYIDVLLKEAGWTKLSKGRELEYPVVGMPTSTNPSGRGYADYVLWGRDGKPLGVLEAKRTMSDARAGKHQAELYADCLEKMHGQRPIIFYSNGFETYIWDDSFYVERAIDGFYTQDELQLLIDRRNTRKDLRQFTVNQTIIDRTYQIEAQQRVAESLVTERKGKLHGLKRQCLLVMATGSGKTRTVAAIMEMLFKCNWIKRVLFLADRNALVTQAKNAFKEHLPYLTAIDLTKEKEDKETRLVFSTYPTIINKIDTTKTDKERYYGVGHFDLIVIDEAHRSVYHKYRAIFEYFDSMVIGLTATPKTEIDRNTYELMGIEDNNPTFAYELDAAVKDKHLVPPRAISVPLKFQREGVKYAELSEDEKQEYEQKFGDPEAGEIPDSISSEALNKWLFNTDTVDKVLEYLMEEGIKVEGGDKLGKTIIFAKNHDHAVFIEKRFNHNYPEYKSKFLRVIDNYESKAEDLIEKFSDPNQEQDPQIAVSVDMMDTGVDAPRVVNLVFFKPVKSLSKFWQMIGRGTRLCKDLFGHRQDKKEFLIFDYCENFEFFDANPQGYTSANPKPLLEQIFETKLRIVQMIKDKTTKTEEASKLRERYLKELHTSVTSLDKDRFMVRKQLKYVKEYSDFQRWQYMSTAEEQEVITHLAHLQVPKKGDDEKARRFDVLVLTHILAFLEEKDVSSSINRIASIARALEKKGNIPQVAKHLKLLREVQTEDYWKNTDLSKLDTLRSSVRDLIKYLEQEKQEPIYTNFKDTLDKENIVEKEPLRTYTNLQPYKDRVEAYIYTKEQRPHKHPQTTKQYSHNKNRTQGLGRNPVYGERRRDKRRVCSRIWRNAARCIHPKHNRTQKGSCPKGICRVFADWKPAS